MIAVDTSVLLRYLLHDDEAQAARADSVFDAAESVLITDVVLAETVWTLSGRKYRLPKAQLVTVLERLFSEPNIRFEDARVVGVPCKRTEAPRPRAEPVWQRAPALPMR